MKMQLAALAVVAVAYATSRESVVLALTGAALLIVVSAGYQRRTHF